MPQMRGQAKVLRCHGPTHKPPDARAVALSVALGGIRPAIPCGWSTIETLRTPARSGCRTDATNGQSGLCNQADVAKACEKTWKTIPTMRQHSSFQSASSRPRPSACDE
jgi:hypothetical protein